ncbi:MAG TPA: ribonuclease D [Moraxellaceae bacterium]|nr:ribonuclease D [Moraxellaceae bacterium]
MNIVHITDNAGLAAMAAALAGRESLALDTEFMRVDTFHPRLALIQVGDGDTEYLVDPLGISDFSPLAPLLLDAAPRKVLHACSEDIEVLCRLLGRKPEGILDTQIGTAFLGQGLQVGYAKALQDNINVEIRKDESRSDWLQRPLSPGQVAYAALDVKFLPALYEQVRGELERRGLTAYFEADCRLMLDELDFNPDPQLLYRDANNAWRLRRQELAVLRALLAWREESARRRDLPRTFLIRNASLFELARKQPATAQALAAIEDMSPRILRKEGDAILAVIAEARRLPEDTWPARLPVPLPRESRDLFDDLRKAARAVAARTGVPEEVLLRKKHVEALVLGRVDLGAEAPLPRAFRGWRGEVLLPVLEPVLAAAAPDLAAWAAERRRAVEATT